MVGTSARFLANNNPYQSINVTERVTRTSFLTEQVQTTLASLASSYDALSLSLDRIDGAPTEDDGDSSSVS